MSGVFIIAEVGQAHDGSLGILHSYIDALSKTGINAVKFQTHLAAAESSEFEPFRIKFSYEDKCRYDYWRRMELSTSQWAEIKLHCEDVGLEFISSPFSNAAVDILEALNVKRYKIGSGEVSNFLMLKKIAQTGKDIILSSGMSTYDELDGAVEFLKPFGNRISVLQCTTSYPTKPSQWGLNVIENLKNRFQLPIGFSDHSGNIYACLAAVTKGAELLEFHAVFDKRMFGPDALASLTMDQIKQLVDGVKQVNESMRIPVEKSDSSSHEKLKRIFEKSLAVNKPLRKGHTISFDDLEAKKPVGFGIKASLFREVIGRRLVRNLEEWSFLNEEDLA